MIESACVSSKTLQDIAENACWGYEEQIDMGNLKDKEVTKEGEVALCH